MFHRPFHFVRDVPELKVQFFPEAVAVSALTLRGVFEPAQSFGGQ